MPRWDPNPRERLEEAALDLFLERGYEATTVAEITRRATLTHRSFYRYFTDKREVLFYGSEELSRQLVTSLAEVAPDLPPIAVAIEAIALAVEHFPERRSYSKRRRSAIEASPELQERELQKLSTLSGVLTRALLDRGAPETEASLSADSSVAIFKVAFERWSGGGTDNDLSALIRETGSQFKAIAAKS